MVEYDVVIPGLRCDVISGSTGYLVLCVMYFWLLPLGNGYWDLFPCSFFVAREFLSHMWIDKGGWISEFGLGIEIPDWGRE